MEEKVKEQLEAAKPEPVIEEVVSAGGGPVFCCFRGSFSPPHPLFSLTLPSSHFFLPFLPPCFPSALSSLPPFLPFSYLCPPSSPEPLQR